MGAIQVTWSREVHSFRGAFSCAIPVTIFLALCGWSFTAALRQAEGSVLQPQTIWGGSVAPWLPILGAVLTMRLFAEERASGMIELLLSSPVRERDLVAGKFLAVMTVVAAALLLSLLGQTMALKMVSAPLAAAFHLLPFLATFCILLLQASLWCSVGMAVSVFSRNPAAASVISLMICCGLPVSFYFAVLFWMPSLRSEIAMLPLLTHVYDFSTGLFSTAVAARYLFPTIFFLFACSKRLAWLRVKG